MDELSIYWLLITGIVAFLYSSVGHGGASGYLAMMAIAGVAPAIARPSALLMNIVVAGIAFFFFYRSGYFRMKIFLPLAFGSVPAAFIGALIPLHDSVYKFILGICLLLAVSRIMFIRSEVTKTRTPSSALLLIIGAATGLLSGMIGIGGGIIISPILILSGWAGIKETAGISALFILVNSAAAVSGVMVQGYVPDYAMLAMTCFAITGGIAGGISGSRVMCSQTIRAILGIVLVIAGIKLMFT